MHLFDETQVVTSISVTDILEDKGTAKALGVGKKAVMCRCWKSGTFPLCDASHVNHNKETGDNVGPLIIDNDTALRDRFGALFRPRCRL